jgi:hypothetical protein
MATNPVIWMTEQDYTRLGHVLGEHVRQSRTLSEVEALEELLGAARVVRAEGMPDDVVRVPVPRP